MTPSSAIDASSPASRPGCVRVARRRLVGRVLRRRAGRRTPPQSTDRRSESPRAARDLELRVERSELRRSVRRVCPSSRRCCFDRGAGTGNCFSVGQVDRAGWSSACRASRTTSGPTCCRGSTRSAGRTRRRARRLERLVLMDATQVDLPSDRSGRRPSWSRSPSLVEQDVVLLASESRSPSPVGTRMVDDVVEIDPVLAETFATLQVRRTSNDTLGRPGASNPWSAHLEPQRSRRAWSDSQSACRTSLR